MTSWHARKPKPDKVVNPSWSDSLRFKHFGTRLPQLYLTEVPSFKISREEFYVYPAALLSKKNVSIEGLAKLEQILSEQIIELAGALARKEAVIQIRTREENFYNIHKQWSDLNREVSRLRNDLDTRNLEHAKEILANPRPNMLPLKVIENKVTIYPL